LKGNPGRRRGSKNKETLLATGLAREQGEELLRKAIEMAMGGNVAMMKFLLDRILPKERPIDLELPHLDFAHDSVDAMSEIVDAVSAGRISPREAADVAQIVSAFRQAIEVTDVEKARGRRPAFLGGDAEMEIDSWKSELLISLHQGNVAGRINGLF
jgi:hypothetical protein